MGFRGCPDYIQPNRDSSWPMALVNSLSLKLVYYSLIEAHGCLGMKPHLLSPRWQGARASGDETTSPLPEMTWSHLRDQRSSSTRSIYIHCMFLSLPSSLFPHSRYLVTSLSLALIYQPMVASDKSSIILCLQAMTLLILLFLLVHLSQLLGMNSKVRITVKVKDYITKANLRFKTKTLDRTTMSRTIQACLGISQLRTPSLPRATPSSRTLDHHGFLRQLLYLEFTPTCLMVFRTMTILLLQPLKKHLLVISLLLRIINITSEKLSSAVIVNSDRKLHRTVVLKEEILMMIKHPTSIRNQTNLNILGSYPTLFTVSLYHHHSQAHLSYSSSTRLIQKGQSALSSIRQHVPNSLIRSGLTFLWEEPSILMLSSVVITQRPTMMSKWKRLGI